MERGAPAGLSARARWASGALILAVASSSGGCERGPSEAPPAKHLVLVTLDTVRADRLGCYGRRNAGTPWLDGVAARGVRFDRAYAHTPLTLPSHVSILTGLLPPRTGVHVNGQIAMSAGVTTLAERLGHDGFYTAAAIGGFPVARRFPVARGFERFDDLLADRRNPAGLERDAEAVVNAALALAAERGERRLFLWVHFFDPHDPYVPPSPFRERFAADPYQGEIASVDAALARLEEGLRATLAIDEVLFAIIADHGEGLGEHGEDTHGLFVYDSTVRVPFLLSGPRVPGGLSIGAPVGSIDLLPTVLDRLGLPVPRGLDGRALELSGKSEAVAPRIYIESELAFRNYGWSPLHAVVDGRFKFIEAPRPEFYDLSTDPGETNDLARSMPPEAAEIRAWLLDQKGNPHAVEVSTVDPRLQSLGYVGTAAHAKEGLLADPKDRLPTYRTFQAASRALEEGRSRTALALVDSLLSSDDSPGVRFQRARALRMEGRLADAEAELDRVARRDSRFPGLAMERTRIAIASGDAATALVEVERHLAEAPGDAEALMFRGAAREMSGEIDSAERDYRRALAVNPLFGSSSLRLAALLVRAGRIAEARATLERHLALHPDDALARGLVGAI